MLNLSLKNGIVFSGIQETEVGTNLLKKRQDEDREDNGHLELMMLLYMQGHHQVKFQFTVKENHMRKCIYNGIYLLWHTK